MLVQCCTTLRQIVGRSAGASLKCYSGLLQQDLPQEKLQTWLRHSLLYLWYNKIRHKALDAGTTMSSFALCRWWNYDFPSKSCLQQCCTPLRQIGRCSAVLLWSPAARSSSKKCCRTDVLDCAILCYVAAKSDTKPNKVIIRGPFLQNYIFLC